MSDTIKKRTKKHNSKRWTQEERDFIKRVYENLDYTIEEIGEAINRSKHAVTKEAKKLGLSRCGFYADKPAKEGHRICATCKQELSLDLFHKNKSKRFGVESSCKACQRLREITKKEEAKKKKIIKEKPKKKCSCCNQVFDNTEEFFHWVTAQETFSSMCRKCRAKRTQQTTEENYRKKGYKK